MKIAPLAGSLLLLGSVNAELQSQTIDHWIAPAQLAGATKLVGTCPGDLNSDGWPELVATRLNLLSGSVHVYDGRSNAWITEVVPSSSATNFGHEIAGIGDVDLDGVPDFAVAAYSDLGGDPNSRVEIRSGATAALLQLIATPLVSSGLSIARTGDLDQDGHADIAIATPSYSSVAAGGVVRAHSGISGAQLWQISHPELNAQLGRALASIGDLDGDGVAELVLGHQATAQGLAKYRIVGGASGATIFEQAFDTVPWVGTSHGFLSLGDLDGDAVPEWVLGASNGPREYSGTSAQAIWKSGYLAPGPLIGAQRLWTPGDVDGDGNSDVLVAGGLIVYALSGRDGSILYNVQGPFTFGQSVVPIGADVDFDGAGDYWVAALDADLGSSGNQPGFFRVSGKAKLAGFDTHRIFEFPGLGTGHRFGTSVSAIGDWTGDGVTEIAAAASQNYPSQPEPGYLRVYDGSSGEVLLTKPGVANGDEFGTHVARLSDLDGDGLAEFAIAAPGATSAGLSNAGVVTVHRGGSGALLNSTSGKQANERYGQVATVGDVDGDGHQDWIAAAPKYKVGTTTLGRCELRSGITGALLAESIGGQPNAMWGFAVAGAGDIDVDGTPDWIASTIPIGPGLNAPSSARILSGATGAVLRTFALAPEPPYYPDLGTLVGAAGDLDADGVPETLVTVRYQYSFGAQPPGVQVHKGSDGALLHFLPYPASYSSTGAVGPAGDFDGDGTGDVLVSNSHVPMTAHGNCRIYSGATGAQLHEYLPDATEEFFGFSAAWLGDTDADGWPDYAIGAPWGDAPALQSGRVLVESGAPRSLVAKQHLIPFQGSGYVQELVLQPPLHVGERFLMLGSASGTAPGFDVAGLHVPLVPDGYFFGLASGVIQSLDVSVGQLDVGGKALVKFELPFPLPAALIGLTLHHAAVLMHGNQAKFVTNAVPVSLVTNF
jgi:FG-GAP repeat